MSAQRLKDLGLGASTAAIEAALEPPQPTRPQFADTELGDEFVADGGSPRLEDEAVAELEPLAIAPLLRSA